MRLLPLFNLRSASAMDVLTTSFSEPRSAVSTSAACGDSGRLDSGVGGDLALVMLAQQPVHEAGDGTQGRLERLAVRRVPRIRQQRDIDRAIALLLRHLDLPHGAILVVLALHDQDRHADMGERIAEIPLAELGIEPGAAPAVER